MLYKIEHIKTETWHQIMDHLQTLGFIETYQYTGMDAGIDYQRYDLQNPVDGELIIFEWDNWLEGEIKAGIDRLDVLREQYQLSAPVKT
ncbi:MAG: hypothetical protein JOZ51_13510 [Chloroflexi bacterium]|nr:hypothetical protein [Chloroflexota bacterium]